MTGQTDRSTPFGYIDRYIDLHCHLDGSITPDIAKRLAEIQNFELPGKDDAELEKYLTVRPESASLTDMLSCFDLALQLLQTKTALSEAVFLVGERMRSHGVIYAEYRFAPQLHTQKGMSQEDAVVSALDGLKRTKLKANLILCCMREGDEATNLETVEIAKKYLTEDGGVVAVDLAGDESRYPTKNYAGIIAKAAEYNIPFTVHAGEADGADSVRAAIGFGTSRIGHGIRMNEDPELDGMIREKGITLEVCPTSNLITDATGGEENYPFMDYLDRGIKVTINSDDPAIEGITIADEFKYMEKRFGLTPEQERKILGYSVDAAFTTERVKAKLRKQLGLDG